VRAGGGPEGLATRTLEVVGAHNLDIELQLDTGRTLRGRAFTAAGAPWQGARVEYVAPPGPDGDVATVGPDGSFAFANLPPGPARLLLWGVRGETFPVLSEGPVLPDSVDALLGGGAFLGAEGSLRVAVRRHDGHAANDAEVRAWQQTTGRGAALDRRDDGAFHAHGLPAGFYRVEVGALGSGFVDLGEQWIDGRGPTDLGTVTLPAPARLVIENDADVDDLELCACRDDVDVRADEIVPWAREVALPAGRWLALWQRHGALVARELELVAGAATTLRIER
jgi:hypothetical protein